MYKITVCQNCLESACCLLRAEGEFVSFVVVVVVVVVVFLSFFSHFSPILYSFLSAQATSSIQQIEDFVFNFGCCLKKCCLEVATEHTVIIRINASGPRINAALE